MRGRVWQLGAATAPRAPGLPGLAHLLVALRRLLEVLRTLPARQVGEQPWRLHDQPLRLQELINTIKIIILVSKRSATCYFHTLVL